MIARRAVSRLRGIARLRFLEGIRGPTLAFLFLFLALAVLAAVLTPGEAGRDRQRALDGFVLDAALLVSVFAAAAFGAASLAGDREAERESILAAGPLRRFELVLGSFAGHAAALVLLVLGLWFGAILVTTGLGGGDRAATRVLLRAERLLDADGHEMPGAGVLARPGAEATYVLPIRAERVGRSPDLHHKAWVHLTEYTSPEAADYPESYPVTVRVGDGPGRNIEVTRGQALEFFLSAEDLAGPELRVTIRRDEPAYALGLTAGGLVVQGARAGFFGNVGKALAAWLLGLLVLAAAAAALSTVVGAPVAIAGTLVVALLGRSLGLLSETARYAATADALPPVVIAGLSGFTKLWPDFGAYDLTEHVTARWNIPLTDLLARVGPAAAAVAVFLAFAWLMLVVRDRR